MSIRGSNQANFARVPPFPDTNHIVELAVEENTGKCMLGRVLNLCFLHYQLSNEATCLGGTNFRGFLWVVLS